MKDFKVANLMGANCTGIEAVYRISGETRTAAIIGCCGQRGIKLCPWRGNPSRPARQMTALPFDLP